MLNKIPIKVAVGIISNSKGQVLIALRPKHVYMPGIWEFPGGKVVVGENCKDALKRELHEELGITVIESIPWLCLQHDYGDRIVQLEVCKVDRFSGQPQGLEGQEIRWIKLHDLSHYTFPPANDFIVHALCETNHNNSFQN